MQSLYSSASSAVFLNNNVSNYFRTTVGVRQGCLLSPILFYLCLENIMRETFHNFKYTISIGGRIISNLRLGDDIDLMGGSNDELQELTDRLSNSAREYGMEISSEKSKVMVNSGDNTVTQGGFTGVFLIPLPSWEAKGYDSFCFGVLPQASVLPLTHSELSLETIINK